ncbi:MAG: VTT domain-containing protein, partial [Gammaproteobacteria bacterium]
MEFFNLTPLLDWIALHPNWAGAAVFLISLAESLAFVGLFIPGTIVMFGVGALIAAGALDLWTTLGLAAAGAVAGDGISYWLGHHNHEQLRVMWPFSRYPQMLTRGEAFFHRHGGKSVLLGRFVGPVRPVIPVVAGMLGMPPGRFLVVNVLSALAWSPAYILPGVIFGASLSLASAVASRLAVLVVIALLLLWFTVWLVRRLVSFLQPRAELMATRLLAWSRSHPVLGGITAVLVDPQRPEARGMLIWAALLVLLVTGILALFETQWMGAPLAHADTAVFYIMQGLRTPWADEVMVLLGELGSGRALGAIVVLVSLGLLLQRHWHAAAHWLAAVAFGAVLITALELALQAPRGNGFSVATTAIPFSHAHMSVVVYGFLAVLIARELPGSRRWVPYTLASVTVIAVALSRLYL